MDEESAFNAALDANPDDWTTRLVYADWLQERGDGRAVGYRAMGTLRLCPVLSRGGCPWYYSESVRHTWGVCGFVALLPTDWFDAIEHPAKHKGLFPCYEICGKSGARRRGVDDAVALAFVELLPARRAALLAASLATPNPVTL